MSPLPHPRRIMAHTERKWTRGVRGCWGRLKGITVSWSGELVWFGFGSFSVSVHLKELAEAPCRRKDLLQATRRPCMWAPRRQESPSFGLRPSSPSRRPPGMSAAAPSTPDAERAEPTPPAQPPKLHLSPHQSPPARDSARSRSVGRSQSLSQAGPAGGGQGAALHGYGHEGSLGALDEAATASGGVTLVRSSNTVSASSRLVRLERNRARLALCVLLFPRLYLHRRAR